MTFDFDDAAEIARVAHAGQVDKGGVEYLLHPLAVARALEPFGMEAQIAGVLHDVVEDSAWTLEMLREAGVPAASVRAVAGVTRDRESGLTYQGWVERMSDLDRYLPGDLVARGALAAAGLSPLLMVPLVPVVKLADNLHNSLPSRSVGGARAASFQVKYGRARAALEAGLPAGVVAVVRAGYGELVP